MDFVVNMRSNIAGKESLQKTAWAPLRSFLSSGRPDSLLRIVVDRVAPA
jgi:hypothetical protein